MRRTADPFPGGSIPSLGSPKRSPARPRPSRGPPEAEGSLRSRYVARLAPGAGTARVPALWGGRSSTSWSRSSRPARGSHAWSLSTRWPPSQEPSRVDLRRTGRPVPSSPPRARPTGRPPGFGQQVRTGRRSTRSSSPRPRGPQSRIPECIGLLPVPSVQGPPSARPPAREGARSRPSPRQPGSRPSSTGSPEGAPSRSIGTTLTRAGPDRPRGTELPVGRARPDSGSQSPAGVPAGRRTPPSPPRDLLSPAALSAPGQGSELVGRDPRLERVLALVELDDPFYGEPLADEVEQLLASTTSGPAQGGIGDSGRSSRVDGSKPCLPVPFGKVPSAFPRTVLAHRPVRAATRLYL